MIDNQMIKITHRALVQNWIKPEEIVNPRTLVLGSFNPYNPNERNDLDYFYGRRTNFFWKTIAGRLNYPEGYFFDPVQGLDRKCQVMTNRFCCMDVINSIEFSCENKNALQNYLDNEIFQKFSDNKIWAHSAGEGLNKILIKRNYNRSIIDFLRNSNSITKVINTMGKTRISNFNLIKPSIGFKQFMQEIIILCNEKNIEFDFLSLSPSQTAVNRGLTPINQLQIWLTENLNL